MVAGYAVSKVDLVWRREFEVRPKMDMLDAPDFAKERAISGPIPEPPPEMTMFLPFVERWGNVGLIDG